MTSKVNYLKFRTIIAIVALLGIISFAGCSKKKISEIDTSKLNVVVILVDTLRSDHLPFYGYHKDTAPFLTTLANKSIVFDNAFSASSYTGPATASVFTSLYPSQHGVITGHFANLRLQKKDQTVTFDKISDDAVTLGEEMTSAGFKSFGLADNLNISKEMGFSQGFSKFETYRYETATKMNKTLKEWKSEIEGSGRYFLYLHYMDPHEPYHKRDPWYQDAPDEKQKEINAYDSEISFVDSHIKEMFELYNWDKNSIVIFLADHGEEFWDHGGFGHGKTLYREVIEVPFFIYVPGITPGRISSHVTTMDILPTLSALLKFQAKDYWEGHNLLPVIESNSQADRSLFSELLRRPEHPRPELRSVVTPDWHYISKKPKGGELHHELYNARTDVREKINEAKNRSQIVTELANRTMNVSKGKVVFKDNVVEQPLSVEGLEELKTLGYAE